MSSPDVSTFTIATDRAGQRRWWLVRIYPDVESLRRAAARYDPRVDFSRCTGVCQTALWLDSETDEFARFGKRGYAGVIRLAQPYLKGEIVAHELLHAAVSTYRMAVDRDVQLGPGVTEREETLAYIFGELYAAFETHFQHPGP